MDSTPAQWPPQDTMVKPMEEMVRYPKGSVERKIRPQKEQILNCPRCNSTNTKFCYYNNYSLSQPRYFCKTCRRYWTEGGSLRNIPVGGGSRKNKRPSPSSSSSAAALNSSSSKRLPDLVLPPQNPNKVFDSPQDLDLGFQLRHHHRDFKGVADMICGLPSFDGGAVSASSSPLELITGLAATSRTFMPAAAALYSSSSGLGFQLPEFKPSSLGFSLDGFGSGGGEGDGDGGGYGSFQGVEEANGKLLFPFEDLKQVSNNGEQSRDQNVDHHNSTGYWNGVIGGGSW